MINWNASAELNKCTIEWLKARFVRFPKSNKLIIAICDNCNKERNVTFQTYTNLCHKCTMINICKNENYRNKMSEIKIKHFKEYPETSLKEKKPLRNGIIPDYNIIKQNKNSTMYLGCYIAEQVLSKIFKNVKMMPFGNHGYDIICDNGYKIEIKSAATGYKGSWQFGIRKNIIADYFLLIAFEDRKNLNPVHLWLIPSKDINHLTNAVIHKSTIKKWTKYEQPHNKLIACCNEMKGEQNE